MSHTNLSLVKGAYPQTTVRNPSRQKFVPLNQFSIAGAKHFFRVANQRERKFLLAFSFGHSTRDSIAYHISFNDFAKPLVHSNFNSAHL